MAHLLDSHRPIASVSISASTKVYATKRIASLAYNLLNKSKLFVNHISSFLHIMAFMPLIRLVAGQQVGVRIGIGSP
ncbi:hypothetical protein ASG19_03970 [Rhizobium sp. Leaf306]|nr:hypothetical protein ASG19_03970 [Rhizobium sp. Leaf306]